MTSELIAIPKDEYNHLLRCKRQLEELTAEIIDKLNMQNDILKMQMQTQDIMNIIQTGGKQ